MLAPAVGACIPLLPARLVLLLLFFAGWGRDGPRLLAPSTLLTGAGDRLILRLTIFFAVDIILLGSAEILGGDLICCALRGNGELRRRLSREGFRL